MVPRQRHARCSARNERPTRRSRSSLERDLATDLGVGLADTITWNVQGVPVRTVMTSLRTLNWARFEANFFVVFAPEASAPSAQQFVIVANVPKGEPLALDPARRGATVPEHLESRHDTRARDDRQHRQSRRAGRFASWDCSRWRWASRCCSARSPPRDEPDCVRACCCAPSARRAPGRARTAGRIRSARRAGRADRDAARIRWRVGTDKVRVQGSVHPAVWPTSPSALECSP